MPYCKNCGKEISDSTKFCPDCGHGTDSIDIGKELKSRTIDLSNKAINSARRFDLNSRLVTLNTNLVLYFASAVGLLINIFLAFSDSLEYQATLFSKEKSSIFDFFDTLILYSDEDILKFAKSVLVFGVVLSVLSIAVIIMPIILNKKLAGKYILPAKISMIYAFITNIAVYIIMIAAMSDGALTKDDASITFWGILFFIECIAEIVLLFKLSSLTKKQQNIEQIQESADSCVED